jgi:hypothetical protein
VLGVEVEAGQRLVQMRNPWGKGVWKSTDPLLERVNAQLLTGSKDDGGIFYMPFEELKLNFEELSICHYHDKYVYSQKRHKYTENDIFPFQIVVEQAGEYYVSISKPDKRFIWAGSADSFMSVVLVKVGKDKSAAYVGGIGGIHRDPFFCAELATGTYVAFVRCSHQVNVNFRGDFAEAQMEFAVNTFGPAKCVIEPIGESRPRAVPHTLQGLLPGQEPAGHLDSFRRSRLRVRAREVLLRPRHRRLRLLRYQEQRQTR